MNKIPDITDPEIREKAKRKINLWIDKQGEEHQHLRPEKILSFDADNWERKIRYEAVDGNTYEYWKNADGREGIGSYEEVEE